MSPAPTPPLKGSASPGSFPEIRTSTKPASAISSLASFTASATDVDHFNSEIAAPIRALDTMAYPRALLLAGCLQAFYLQRRDTHPNLLVIVHMHLRAIAQIRFSQT